MTDLHELACQRGFKLLLRSSGGKQAEIGSCLTYLDVVEPTGDQTELVARVSLTPQIPVERAAQDALDLLAPRRRREAA